MTKASRSYSTTGSLSASLFLGKQRMLFPQNCFSMKEKRLVFEDAPPAPPAGGAGDPPPADPKTPPTDPAPKDPPPEDPKKPGNSAEARIKELTDKVTKSEQEKQELAKKLADRDEADKKNAGKYEQLWQEERDKNTKLASEHESVESRLKGVELVLQGQVDEALKAIPDENKEFVTEMLEGKTLEKKAELLPKLVEKFGKPGSKPFGGSLPGGGSNPPAGDPAIDGLQKEQRELLDKVGKKTATPSERARLTQVSSELQTLIKSGKFTLEVPKPRTDENKDFVS